MKNINKKAHNSHTKQKEIYMKNLLKLCMLMAVLSSSAVFASTSRFNCLLSKGQGPTPSVVFIQDEGRSVQFRYFPKNGTGLGQIDILGRQISSDIASRTYGDLNRIDAFTREVITPVVGTLTLDADIASAKEANDYHNPIYGSVEINLNNISGTYWCSELFD